MAHDLLESVSRLARFTDLGHDEIEALLGFTRDVSYDEGTWVVRRGDSDTGLHIIVEGTAGVVLEDEELAMLSTGSFFGEISALLGEATVADVVARAHLRCLVVAADDVERFLLSNPVVMLRMLKAEARRLMTTDELRT